MNDLPLPSVVRAVHALDQALTGAGLDYAVGGALALAFCVAEPRATADVDLTVLLGPDEAGLLRPALQDVVDLDDDDLRRLATTGQAERLSTQGVRVDLFLAMAQLHHDAVGRAVRHDLAGRAVPFMACHDLATFKVLFDRPKDWVDLTEMRRAGLDVAPVRANLETLFGDGDEDVEAAVERLTALPDPG